ncbi:Mitogen-activated protein kinase kinase kinase NPK1 [Linum grandiflorum]
MQDLFGSVRRSLVFTSTTSVDDAGARFTGFVGKLGSSIRKSRNGLFAKPPPALPPPCRKDDGPPIRWRKGELIGSGAFGRVYMGMNLDSGELLAVKQVLIAANSASKEKTQAHIRELEEEVKLLKNLSHPNIVRYLGTVREADSLNILLEFVPGGSISSLLGKFGSFPESVIRMYTKQLLLGLEYLHKNGIMHRDIKGANILVDNKGCIKLADFGASKKVVELATLNGAKSMKGTPYWMAPEVILQTGHSFSADIWSVGCTIIEMATGKPPWSQQYQEVAALFHIGTTKSHPPIPEHLSAEAKDFLLKCLQKEPDFRASASDLLKHPFITEDYNESSLPFRNSLRDSRNSMTSTGINLRNSMNHSIRRSCGGLKDVGEMGGIRSSMIHPESTSGSGSYWHGANSDDDMCQMDDTDDFMVRTSSRFKSVFSSTDLNKSFNPMCEPTDEWPSMSNGSSGMRRSELRSSQLINEGLNSSLEMSAKEGNEFTFPSGSLATEDDEEVTESKIRAFLDEKALDLKKLQTKFYSTLTPIGKKNNENIRGSVSLLPPKSKSPKQLMMSRRLSSVVDAGMNASYRANENGIIDSRALHEIHSPQSNHRDEQQKSITSSASFSEQQRKWKQELDEELERQREMMRQAGVSPKKSPSPNDPVLVRQRSARMRFPFSGK